MSLEDTIALAANEVGQARDEIMGLVNVAQTQIGRVTDAYNDHLSTLTTNFRIDQENGDDNNSGSDANPLASLNEAISRTPRGGSCTAIMKNSYHFSEDLTLPGRRISIQGDQGGTFHQMTFEPRSYDYNNVTYRALRGITLDNGHVDIYHMDVVVPTLAAPYSSMAHIALAAPIRSAFASGMAGHGSVTLRYSELTIPANPFSNVVGAFGDIIGLYLYSVATNDQPYLGRLYRSAANTSGTPRENFPGMSTNLTQL